MFAMDRLYTLIPALLLAAGLTACGERLSDTRAKTPKPVAASPSAVVIGQAPAEPTGDPPGTTPVAGGTTTITKEEESKAKPQEGDNHSHSTTAEVTPQKAQGVSTTANDDSKGTK
jgi:hypothetical protein